MKRTQRHKNNKDKLECNESKSIDIFITTIIINLRVLF